MSRSGASWRGVLAACAVLGALAAAPLAAQETPLPGYAGTAACATCHPKQAKSWPHSSMAQALEPVERCRILIANPELTHTQGKYTTKIVRTGDQSTYTVTDGVDTWSAPIRYAFGQGAAGQTYVLQKDGSAYESRLSYYKSVKGLDLTMGAQSSLPKTLEDAAGRRIFRKDAGECFGCHSLSKFGTQGLMPAQIVSGVQCESCHGPSLEHVEGFKQSKLVKQRKLSTLNAEEVSEFCGQCHRTWAQIAMNGPHGVGNVRFQPYRLAISKCFDATDRRIACVACHNPHEALNRNRASYDGKCLACHTAGAKANAKVCPVKNEGCVGCHMATYEAPQSHWPFTDHNIRIVRAGEKYPD